MINKPLPRETVERECPEGKVCGYKEHCTLAEIHDNCSLYHEALRKARGEPDLNIPNLKPHG